MNSEIKINRSGDFFVYKIHTMKRKGEGDMKKLIEVKELKNVMDIIER